MEFIEIKRIIDDEAKLRSVDEYELYYSKGTSISTETLKSEISSFASSASGGLCFRCITDGKMGYAATELFEEEELRSLVTRACENAKSIEKAEGEIFAGSKEYEELPERKYAPMTAGDLKKIALEIQEKTYAEDSRVTDGTQSAAVTSYSELHISNSHGLELSRSAGASVVYAMPVIKDGDESQSGFEMEIYSNNTDPEKLAKGAVEKAISKLGARSIPSGKYNVVLDGKQMRTLLGVFSAAFSAKQAQSGLSLLAGKEGEKIGADIVTLTDDPMRDEMPFITNFDAEGVAAHKKTVIDHGVLKTLLYNLETAKKAGVESTGNASKGGYDSPVGISPYAFFIEAGDRSLDELFAQADNGIYITELKGLHAGADAVTGDFSVESAGYMIEGGKKTYAIKNFTIAGNFFKLLLDIVALSDKIEYGVPGGYTVIGAPAALLRDMSVAGE